MLERVLELVLARARRGKNAQGGPGHLHSSRESELPS